MAEFSFSTALTANQQNVNPIASAFWQWETPSYPYLAKLVARATGVSSRLSIFNGPVNIKQKSIIQSGGTAGVTPSELNTTPQYWQGDANQRIGIILDEVGGLTPTVDATLTIEPDYSRL